MEGEVLAADVAVEVLGRLTEEPGVAKQAHEGGIEVAEGVVFEMGIIAEGPLAAGVMAGPAVAFAGEIEPLGMAEFVAHEIEPAFAA